MIKAIGSEPFVAREAYFSPEDTCQDRIVRFLDEASSSLDICVFTLTDDVITRAIEAAFRRGIEIRIVTDGDKSADRGSDADRLAAAGIALRIDHSSGHMHHKFAIRDRHVLLNGSNNWTRSAAMSHFENLSISGDRFLVERYREEFERLWKLFEPAP